MNEDYKGTLPLLTWSGALKINPSGLDEYRSYSLLQHVECCVNPSRLRLFGSPFRNRNPPPSLNRGNSSRRASFTSSSHIEGKNSTSSPLDQPPSVDPFQNRSWEFETDLCVTVCAKHTKRCFQAGPSYLERGNFPGLRFLKLNN